LEDSTAQVAVVTNKGPVSTVKVVRPVTSPAAKAKAALDSLETERAALAQAIALYQAGRNVEAQEVLNKAKASIKPVETPALPAETAPTEPPVEPPVAP
jgi:exonuclease VII small subunit